MQSAYKVNIAKLEGEGEFPCPKCGTMISPDDESETVYNVVDIVMKDEENIETMLIRCNKCNSLIKLSGFESLPEEENTRITVSEPLPESKAGYSTHHKVLLDGKELGNITVEFAQAADIEGFKKVKTLHVGDAFKGAFALNAEKSSIPDEDFQELIKALRKKFKGLKEGDIFVSEIKGGRKNIVGRF
jgi:hypothetical protein